MRSWRQCTTFSRRFRRNRKYLVGAFDVTEKFDRKYTHHCWYSCIFVGVRRLWRWHYENTFMRYCYNILISLVFVSFTKIGRHKLLSKVVGCVNSPIALPIMYLPSSKWISVPMHESSHRPKMHFPNTQLDTLLSACLDFMTPLQRCISP